MKEKLGVQVFTVRDYMNSNDQVRETFTKLKKIGYDYIQTAGMNGISYEDYGRIARECGLEICGTHDSFDMMVDKPEESITNHRMLDTIYAGIGGYGFDGSDGTWRTKGYHNDEQLFGTIDKINKAAKIFVRTDLRLRTTIMLGSLQSTREKRLFSISLTAQIPMRFQFVLILIGHSMAAQMYAIL